MNQKTNWEEMVRNYPNEWVALIDYEQKDPVEIEGIVVAHGPDRKLFHETVGQLLPQYGDMAIRYTGELVKNPELPLLMADFSYRLNRRLIVIPVILYGRRGHLESEFILDTGASSTIVDHSLASALGYSARDGVGLSKVSSVVGKEKGYRLIKVYSP